MVDILNVVVGLFATIFFGFCAWGLTAHIKPTESDKEQPNYTPFDPIIAIVMIVLFGYLAISIFNKLVL